MLNLDAAISKRRRLDAGSDPVPSTDPSSAGASTGTAESARAATRARLYRGASPESEHSLQGERRRVTPAPAPERGRGPTPVGQALAAQLEQLSVADAYSAPVNGLHLRRRLAGVAARLMGGESALFSDARFPTAHAPSPPASAPNNEVLPMPRLPRRTCASLPRLPHIERAHADGHRPRASTFPRTPLELPRQRSPQHPTTVEPAEAQAQTDAQSESVRRNALGLRFGA